MTTTTTTQETMTIRMSDRAPVKLIKAEWPIVATGKAYNGTIQCQATDEASIIVRQHGDGRIIVYGSAGDGDGSSRMNRESRSAGYLVLKGESPVRAIHRVAGVLAGTDYCGELAQTAARRCISDLPAQEL